MSATRRKPTAEELEALKQRLSSLSHDEKIALAAKAKPLLVNKESAPARDRAPQTDDELHAAIIRETGFNIPRVAVCEDHCAPFDPIADGFFHRRPGILILKSREAGGTLNVSILQYMLCKYVPMHEGVTFGAIQNQAEKAFDYVKQFVQERVTNKDGTVEKRTKPEIDGDPLRKRIAWKVGSLLSIIIGTESGVNSPHPNTAHADELDLMEEKVIDQAANMSSSTLLPDGSRIPALDIITSTRKTMHGPMQKMIEEINQAETQGYDAAFKLYAYCFSPETLVRTKRGYLPIKDIVIGDEVLSRGGVYRKVKNTMRREFQGNIIKLRTVTGLPVRVTPEHLFSSVVDEKNWLSAKKPTSNRKHGFHECWVEAENLEAGNFCRLEVPMETFDIEEIIAPEETYGNPSDGRNRRFYESYKLSSDFLWAIGLYIAEGHSAQGMIAYSLDCDENEYVERIRRCFEPMGFKVTRQDSAGSATSRSIQVCVYSTQLSEWWEKWIGKGSSNKSIPCELLNLPSDKLSCVIEGVLNGDGCDRFDTLYQTSSMLALQVVEAGLRVGGVPSLSIPAIKQLNRKQVYSVVRSSGSKNVAEGRSLDRVNAPHKSPRGFWEIEGQRYSKIRDYEEEFYDGFVYDLTIDGDPSFVVGNTLVHNCIAETGEEVPNCRGAKDTERQARLKELGLDPSSKCSCDKAVKGEWDEGVPRTLETVCNGRFFRSRGWMSHEDVKRKFRRNSQAVWEAEMECRRPMADGLYLPGWRRERFAITGWMPKSELGNIWQSVDWGGTDLNAVLWSQGPLRVPVTMKISDKEVEIPRGAYVIFDELLDADVGATRLADMVLAREMTWRRKIPGFRVTARFADMAGKQSRNDWREHNPPLITSWYLSDRKFEPTVRVMQDLVGDKRYWVDARCAHHMDDIESWRQKDGREVHDVASHTMASSRYLHANTETLERRRLHKEPANTILPVVVQRADNKGGSGVAVSGGADPFAGERKWRENLGGPMPQGWGR